MDRIGSLGVAALAGTLALGLAGSCRQPVGVDSFGGPSAFARLEGHVHLGNGDAAPVGTRLLLTRCGAPIGGKAGESTTGTGGEYSLLASVPPAAYPAGADSLLIVCELIADGGVGSSGPIDVYFFPSTEPTVLHVDIGS